MSNFLKKNLINEKTNTKCIFVSKTVEKWGKIFIFRSWKNPKLRKLRI